MGHTCWAGPTDPSRSLQTEGGTEEHCSGTEPPLPHFLLSADDRPLRQKVQHFKYNAIKYVFAFFYHLICWIHCYLVLFQFVMKGFMIMTSSNLFPFLFMPHVGPGTVIVLVSEVIFNTDLKGNIETVNIYTVKPKIIQVLNIIVICFLLVGAETYYS